MRIFSQCVKYLAFSRKPSDLLQVPGQDGVASSERGDDLVGLVHGDGREVGER